MEISKNKDTDNNLKKPFPWLDFNKELALSHGGSRFVIAFDPSYINKSGKKNTRCGLVLVWLCRTGKMGP
ncbi:hypothetical protein [Tangfeifania diversioriginum]|uniref:hypothetical protein n=1 Tax=Tangfeifania diversioriginum TaxID=1168035 RepID=UPI000932FC2E|nr:hypothetical protein [Tangfeifania diversioriginum]